MDTEYANRRRALAARWHGIGAADRAEQPDATNEDCPAPLSGEWAGESIPELLNIPTGAEWDEWAVETYNVTFDDVAEIVEESYAAGWVGEAAPDMEPGWRIVEI